MRKFVIALVMAVSLLPQLARAEVNLVMAEQPGCIYCIRWDREIAHIYPKTAVGKAAPLLRYNIREDAPPVTLANSVRFTPTFILARDGVEIGRLEGYPSEDFFWGLIERMVVEAGFSVEDEGSS